MEFFIHSNFYETDESILPWPVTFNQAKVIIERIRFCSCTTELISLVKFANQDILFVKDEASVFLKNIKIFDYNNLAIAYLFFI